MGKDAPVWLLAIVCIVAIVFIVHFVDNYVATHAPSAQSADTTGQAFMINSPSSPGLSISYPDTDPTAYAYLRN